MVSLDVMIEAYAHNHGPVLGFRLSGTLHTSDYRGFAPAIESAIERHGRLRLLLHFENFDGWDAGALWSDLKFRAQHFIDIERIAFVGENRRDQALALLLRPFTAAELRYYDVGELADAWAWLEEGLRQRHAVRAASGILPVVVPEGGFRPNPLTYHR
jgi:hypothetical protein